MSPEWIQLFETRLSATYCSQGCVIPRGVASRRIAAGKLTPFAMTVNNSFSACEIRAGDLRTGLVLLAEAVHVFSAAAALRKSQVIAVPTDTLYWIACDARSENAIQKIYNIKGRSSTKPLAICVADVENIELYGTGKHLPEGLLGALFPGPLTLMLPPGASSVLDRSFNPGHDSED